MEDGNEKNQRFERKPNFEMATKLSRDGRYWIIKRVETWILPRKYMDVIAQNHGLETNRTEDSTPKEKSQRKGKRNADSHGQGN